MTKQEFETLVGDSTDAAVYFRLSGRLKHIVNCHIELPNSLVLGFSPLNLCIEFLLFAGLTAHKHYVVAPKDALIKVRYEGRDYHPTTITKERGKIIFNL